MLTCTVTGGAAAVITVTGRVDAYGVTLLEQALAPHRDAITAAVLDLAGVEFMSSAGLRVLLTLHRHCGARGGRFILAAVPPVVMQTLAVSGMQQRFTIAPDTAAAQALLADPGAPAATRFRCAEHDLPVTACPGTQAALRRWDAPAGTPLRLSLRELGLAVGVGAFGATAAQAAAAPGLLLATGSTAVLQPAAPHGVADTLVAADPDSTDLYVTRALSLDGDPVATVPLPDTPLALAALAGAAGNHPLQVLLISTPCARGAGVFCTTPGELDGATPSGTQALDTPALIVAVRLAPGQPLTGTLPAATIAADGAAWHISVLTLAQPVAAATPAAALHDAGTLDQLTGLLLGTPALTVTGGRLWTYLPAAVSDGAAGLLQIETPDGDDFREEWQVITRRIYRDAARVALTPLTGGFTSKTYRVASYDRDGRQLLPTVMKLGGLEVTRREVDAYRACVEKFILNNSTTIMGSAACGDAAGLRYNFVGVTGGAGTLTWLENLYRTEPADQVIALCDRVFTDILKPWYGQPRAARLRPFADHDPRHLFPALLPGAQSYGINLDAPVIACPELECELPNPYHFFVHDWPQWAAREWDWSTGITHGDLNLKNILVDDRANLYVIDFSESRERSIIADFARLEPICGIELTRCDNADDIRRLARYYAALTEARTLTDRPACPAADDPLLDKALRLTWRLREYAVAALGGRTDLAPYLAVLLEWTLPMTGWVMPAPRQRVAVIAAALIVRQLQRL